MSAGDACSKAAFRAGCGSSSAIVVSHPPYEMPSMPTRPLFPSTFWSIHSIVSYASVPSSIPLASLRARGGRCITNCPSELKRPNILEGEDVAIAKEMLVGGHEGAFRGPRAIRRPLEEDGQL